MRKIKNRVFFYNAIFALSAIDRDQENYLMASLFTIEIKKRGFFIFAESIHFFSVYVRVYYIF